jgi:hypothetical protein
MLDTHQPYANTLPEGVREYGFTVEHAPRHEDYGTLIPLEDITASAGEMQDDLRTRLAKEDDIRVLAPGEQEQSDEQLKIVVGSEVTVAQSRYDELVAEGLLKSNKQVFGPDDVSVKKVFWGDSAAEAGLRTQFADEEKRAIEETAMQVAWQMYEADYNSMPDYAYEQVQGMSQVFEFESWGTKVRLYNFTETLVDDDQLAHIANALREMSQLTGGTVMKDLKVMAILPEESKCWRREKADGTPAVVNAQAHYGALMFNERIVRDNKGAVGGHETSYAVGGGDLETVTFHELTHIIEHPADRGVSIATAEGLGWDMANDDLQYTGHTFRADRTNPSEYSSTRPSEHIPEAATALFAGGEWANGVDSEGLLAIQGLYAARHSEQKGPAFVRVREVDLHNLPQKFGLDLEAKYALYADVMYRVEQDA